MYDGIHMQFKRPVLFYRSPLKPLQQRVLDREIIGLGDTDDETVYGPGPTMVVWVSTLLHRLPFIDQERWRLIFNESAGAFESFGCEIATALQEAKTDELSADGPATIKNFQLAFVDGRYVTWSSLTMQGFVDMQTGRRVDKLPFPPLESASYNLTELARREFLRCSAVQKTLEGSKDATGFATQG